VTVFQACDLNPGTRIDKTDPYVVLEMVDVKDSQFSTGVAWNAGSSPLWRENFAFRLSSPSSVTLKFAVWDKDTYTEDDLLGEATLDVTECIGAIGKSFDHMIPLQRAASSSEKPAGRIRIMVKYLAAPSSVADSLGSATPAGVLTLVLEEGKQIRESAKDSMSALNKPDPYVVVSLGEQTFRSATKFKTRDPVWKETIRFVLQRGHQYQTIRFSMHDRDLMTSGDVISLCDFSVTELAAGGGESVVLSRDLLPNPARWGAAFQDGPVMGKLTVSATFEPIREVEQRFWLQWFGALDVDHSGCLQAEEFATFLSAVSSKSLMEADAKRIFDEANTNNDEGVTIAELAEYLVGKRAADLIDPNLLSAWLSSPVNLAPGTKQMAGGFAVESEARVQGLFGMLSDWTSNDNSYVKGLNQGEKAKHILVWNREKALLEEEVINPAINLGMRLLYQSAFGAMLRKTNKTKDMIKAMSEDQGRKYNKPDSKDKIAGFVETFHINMEEAALPIDGYETFNAFFARKLQPSARPIASPEDPKVAVQPADCRLMVFDTLDEATSLWVKGKAFTLPALLGSEEAARPFVGGAISIHRLAPQDYHRFHSPVDGRITNRHPIPGDLWTVNPVAINMVDVFTENKRTVTHISSDVFGEVAYVNVGAHMVGAMEFTAQEGETMTKGQDYGYFEFGGSTVICVWQKDKILFNGDIIAKSKESTEMLVKMGTPLGVAFNS